MNCPSCSAPMLLGSSACHCGYQCSAEDRPLEISYWEALRVWWRIYWPAQLVSAVLLSLISRGFLMYENQWRAEHPLEASPLAGYLRILTPGLTFLLGAIFLWVFVPRILGRGYRGFRLTACAADSEIAKLDGLQRAGLWFFIWWRQIAGGLLALLLAMPLNMLLGTMRISASSLIAAAAGLFGVGPVIIKMLVGNPLNGFQIETRRAAVVVDQVEAAPTLKD